MADNPRNPTIAGADNPFVTGGMRRRAAEAARPVDTTTDVVDPYAGNWAAETARSQLQRTANYVPAVEGLVRRGLGDNEGAARAFGRFEEGEQRARDLGPAVQTFDDAAAAGGGFGDYASALGYMGAAFVPDMAASLTGAGIGAVAGKQIAKGAVRRAVGDRLGDAATRSGVRQAAQDSAGAAAGRKAMGLTDDLAQRADAPLAKRMTGDPAKIAGEMRTARSGADALLNKRLGQQAKRIMGEQGVGADTIQAATTAGRIGGATAGQYPGMTAESVDQLQIADDAGVGKIALANLGASALGAIPVERIFGRFGAEATEQVRKNADGFFKRLGKEYVKQGSTEAGTEVAQQAVQLAGQKWANDNIDLLGPEAMNAYLASAVGGFVAGGALGAGAEVGRSGIDATARGGEAVARGARAVGQQVQDAYGKVRASLASSADRARKAWDARQSGSSAGLEVGPDGVVRQPGAEGGAAPADKARRDANIKRGLDQAEAKARRLWEGMTAPDSPSVGDRFRENLDKIKGQAAGATATVKKWWEQGFSDQDLEASTEETAGLFGAYDRGDAPMAALDQSPAKNPVQLENRWQNSLVAAIPHDNAIWSSELLIQRVGATLEKVLFNKDLSAEDIQLVNDLTEGPNPIIAPHYMEAWGAAARDIGPASDKLQEWGNQRDDDVDTDIDPAAAAPEGTVSDFGSELQRALEADRAASNEISVEEPDATSGELGVDGEAEQRSGSVDDVRGARDALPANSPAERIASTFVTGRDLKKQLDALPDDAPADQRKDIADRLAAAQAEHVAARTELRAQITGAPRENGSFNNFETENMSTAGRAKFAQLRNDAGRVELVDTVRERLPHNPNIPNSGREVDKRALLRLSTVVQRKVAEMSRDFDQGDKGRKALRRAAVMQAFADIHAAGIQIKPESITAGDITARDGTFIARITKAMAADLQAQVPTPARRAGAAPSVTTDQITSVDGETATGAKKAKRASSKPGKVDPDDFPTGAPGVRAMDARRTGRATRTVRDTEARERQMQTEVRQGEDQFDGGEHKLVPRKAPEGARSAQGDFVSTEALVTDVNLKANPYEDNLNRVRRAREEHGPGPEYAKAMHEEGVKIGEAELAKQLENGDITARSHALQLKTLRDPEKGRARARKYALDASKGVYDGASVTERRALGKAKDEVDTDALRTEQYGGFDRAGPIEGYGSDPGRDSDTMSPQDLSNAKARNDMDLRNVQAARMAMQDGIAGTAPGHVARKPLPKAEQKAAPKKRVVKRDEGLADESTVAHSVAAKIEAMTTAAEGQRHLDAAFERMKRGMTPFAMNNTVAEALKIALKFGSDLKASTATQIEAMVDLANAALAKAGKTPFPQKLVDAGLAAIRGGATPKAPDVVSTIARSTGDKHDIKAEEAMLNAQLKAMGIKDPIKLYSGELEAKLRGKPMAAGTAGRYYRDGSIFISPRMSGAERVEVLAHELGHHVVFSQALSAAGIPFSEAANISPRRAIALMRKHNRALFDGLSKDYRAWVAANPKTMKYGESRATRAPFHRASHFLAQAITHPDATVGGLPAGAQAYHYSAHEWMADNIARALTTNPKSTDIIGQFFKGIADRLKLVYNTLFGTPQAKKMAPAPSVEAWINGLFDADTLAVADALGKPVSKAQAETSIKASVAGRIAGAWAAIRGESPPPRGPTNPNSGDAWSPGGPEIMAFIRDVMGTHERQVLDRVFNRAAVVSKLRAHYAGSPAALKLMDDAQTGLEGRIALGYLAWQQGAFDVTPGTASAFWGLGGDMASIFNLAGDGTYAVRILNDMSNGTIQRLHDAGKTYSVKDLEARARGTRQQIYDRFGDATEVITKPFARFMDSKARRMWDAGIPALREAMAFVQRPQGTTGDDRGMTPAVVHATARLASRAANIMGDLSPKESARVMDMMQRQLRPGAEGWVGGPKVAEAAKKLDKLFDGVYAYMKRAGIDVGKREAFFPIVFDVRNDKVKQRLTDLYSQPKFEAHIREAFGKLEAAGGRAAGTKAKANTQGAPAADMPPVSQEVLDFFARRRAKSTQGRAADTNAEIVEAFKTGDVPALERHIAAAEKRMDRPYSDEVKAFIELELRYARARISELKGYYAGKVGAVTGAAPAEAATGGPSQRPIEDLVNDLVEGAMNSGRTAPTSGENAPNFSGENWRLSQFIYDHGDAADLKAFASVQTKDPAELFSRYLEPMVRRAEYTRRARPHTLTADMVRERAEAKVARADFDDVALYKEAKAKAGAAAVAAHKRKHGTGANLELMFERIEQQGGTKEDVALARNAVAAAMGTYGVAESPTLKAISPALAARFSGEKTRATIQGLQAYQNARLLPLATLSSLVDPMGIAVRSGGDFKASWDGWKVGVQTIFSKAKREEIHQMLAQLGSTEDMSTMEALQSGFGGANNRTAAAVNSFIFKYNGLAAYTRATRYMALVSGHGFLLKHADGKTDKSLRYLHELGLEPGDITADPKNPQRVKITPKSQRALLQFVDEAILRPNSQQTPMWHSDPYMGLVTQYKAFAYAIFDQVVGRIMREGQHMNPGVLFAAAAYLPVVIAAELLRELVQHGPDGNPRRKNWEADDYAMHAVTKTGLLGPKFDLVDGVLEDSKRGNVVGSSQLGPTGQQAKNVLTTRNIGKTAEDALPGSAAWKRWNDGSGAGGKAKSAET